LLLLAYLKFTKISHIQIRIVLYRFTYLAAIDEFHSRLSKEEIDEITLGK